MRDRFLRVIVLFGVALLVITESLSAFHALTRGPLIAVWIIAIGALLSIPFSRGLFRVTPPSFRFDPVILLCVLGMTAIFTLTAITAAFSPPNSADAMAYHMPRVAYWAEMHSVRFFPTQYFNQIMLQPLAEYLMLHTYILSGGDHFINFVQWGSSVVCAIGVSAIAACLGIKARGQWLAALFCAALPSGILASSGAKNDYFMAMWLVAAVYFAFRLVQTLSWTDAAYAGAACGLALCTKATAYLFAPFVLLAVLGPALTKAPRKIAALLAIAFALNMPQYARNYSLSGSPMGFDSAQGDHVYRWRNEYFGWKPTLSNLLRNISDQLGGRSNQWNAAVYETVHGIHWRLGMDINDPATTWPGAEYRAPRNANHEADAPNRLAFLVLAILGCISLFNPRRALYGISIAIAFIAFCAYLKWQPFMARLLLPLFVLASPLAGTLDEFPLPVIFELALCLLLLDSARLPALENWVRPLRGPQSVLHTDRNRQYFADMTQWSNSASYYDTARRLSATRCGVIGIDITRFQLEYPLQALLREQDPNVLFVHTGVNNVSGKYAPPISGEPCAVVCLECANSPAQLSLYRDYRKSATAGNFVIFTR